MCHAMLQRAREALISARRVELLCSNYPCDRSLRTLSTAHCCLAVGTSMNSQYILRATLIYTCTFENCKLIPVLLLPAFCCNAA
jgi:hypothetical protein